MMVLYSLCTAGGGIEERGSSRENVTPHHRGE